MSRCSAHPTAPVAHRFPHGVICDGAPEDGDPDDSPNPMLHTPDENILITADQYNTLSRGSQSGPNVRIGMNMRGDLSVKEPSDA